MLRDPNSPTLYSELPKNRADSAPKSADLLGNVTSRARDVVPGGEAPIPRLHGEEHVPMVKLERKEPATPPQPVTTVRSPEVGLNGIRSAETWKLAARLPAWSSDVPQPEMDNPGGNAPLAGDVSLNTTAWDYAPWLDRYRSRLLSLWFAPPAYSLGILKEGGWAEIEVEISRSGQVLRVDLLGQQGHPSLIRAAESAVRATAPTDALPADFPEPTLILRIRMFYPQLRPR
jgi:outer membrane biosynthesis protein TonB